MPQHFLLSAEARNLSPIAIARMSEYEAVMTMKKLHWSAGGEVACPRCGEKHQAYFIKTRHQWQCKHCNYRFSVTAGTLFAHHKLPLRDILFACSLYVNAAKGISALQIARDLNVQYKTAFVLLHKIKEALKVHKQREAMQLSGIVHMDATYVHSSQKPKNKKSERVDRRLKQHENPLKRAILVMRDSFAKQDDKQDAKQIGARNTIAFVAKSENSKVVNNLANKHIAKGSTIHTDESPAYDNLIYFHDLKRVNHQKEYRSDAGVTNNLAESYFSRFKRMYYGQVHKMNNTYLYEYANEVAYREDTRRLSNGVIFNDVVSKCLTSLPSDDWRGYWQGNKKRVETLAA
ncbi:IS1595 family transposase [Moraxella sp. FZLJ2107]|uniref:IS1595 family transposase n=1 Tax=unclassified Moraxella TaxID=2685852 RepID=UPI0020C906DA|nr:MULTISPECIES: IS1595 family transposase [unclassified Moraxella]UTO05669.1 IS1595 family transposase [Moraxella sp. FZLJ2107]UTO22405.1 IS1595 family transposase [Moraxella sp. FZLJ2109]